MKDVPLLHGYNCSLSEISEDDTDFVISIRTQTELNALSGTSISHEMHVKWLKDYNNRDDDYYWIVRDSVSGDRIGTTALINIDNKSKKAESGRTIVLPQYRHLVFDVFLTRSLFSFDTLGLNRIYGKVRESSPDILKFDVDKLGYKVEGFLRDDWWDGSRFHSFYLISMLKSEFEEHKAVKYQKYIRSLKLLSHIARSDK